MSTAGRACLVELALLPEDQSPLSRLKRGDREQIELMLDADHALHRLLRDFILDPDTKTPVDPKVVQAAVATALSRGLWNRAFELIQRFSLSDLVEPAICAAFVPLVREGRLWTLKVFIEATQIDSTARAATEVVRAEVARANGDYGTVLDAVEYAKQGISDGHPLASRLAALEAEGHFWKLDEAAVRQAVERATQLAQADYDRDYADFLSLRAHVYLLEQNPPAKTMEALRRAGARDYTARLRYASARLSISRILGVTVDLLPIIEDATPAVEHSTDVNAKSAFFHIAAYALTLRGDYSLALSYISKNDEIADTFDITFALPQIWWLSAVIRIGLRDYRTSAQLLEKLDHLVAERPSPLHESNARVLRARFLIATGRPSDALTHMLAPPPEPTFRAITGEYLGMAALTLALSGDEQRAIDCATKAETMSRCIEGQLLSATARAVIAPDPNGPAVLKLFEMANRLSCWDPVLIALRASRSFLTAVKDQPQLVGMLQALCTRAGDRHLAHALGVTAATVQPAAGVLSPREQEVLGLLEAGLRNHEIAAALFISDATVKVHIRHIFEKLQVRTRAQAVARAHRFGD